VKVTKLDLDKFSVFEKATFEFSRGINVFIGANGTGKSHLLKMIYSVLKANRDAALKNGAAHQSFQTLLAQKLSGVYRPDNDQISRLVTRVRGGQRMTAHLSSDAGEAKFSVNKQGKLSVSKETLPLSEPCIFIPSREALAMYEGFIKAYTERELSFDETYFDLCVALSGSQLRGPRLEKIRQLASPLEDILEGRVAIQGARFYLFKTKGKGNFEAHLLAEGLRKIGGLYHLIVNGSIIEKGFLLWDEPEANLNPKLVRKIAETLRRLAAFGIQVFVATHDYLLSNELSLAMEYADAQPADLKCDIRFFALTKTAEAGVTVEHGRTLPELQHNDILAEFAAHYDRESRLMAQTSPLKKPEHADHTDRK
jgi:energy-coupling factor transporter ATP-binding protein EcfA2